MRSIAATSLMWAALACIATGSGTTRAQAEALLVIEADSGKVLFAENAAHPWYPASVTKLMTAYVTLRAVKEGRLTLDEPLTVSANAAAQAPVKMGFPAGTIVTVDNALKMLMVKSANDIAVVLAEGVAGSIENFAEQMNLAAQRLGMRQSTFVNPNGLPADDQVSSARDLAILARALIREMPEYDYYWNLPGIRMGKKVQRNYNTLIDRYPGADGMKTGFICASGFNLVASATRDGKRLIAVVLGAPSSAARALKAAQLLERGFSSRHALSWLMPPLGTVDWLPPVDADPPNLRDEMCGKHRKRPATENEDEFVTANMAPDSPYAVFLSTLRPPPANGAHSLPNVHWREPVLVFTGTKPPAPGAASAAAKLNTEKKKTAAKPPAAAKGTAGTAPASVAATAAGDATVARPKPSTQRTAPKPAPTNVTAPSRRATAAVTAPADAAVAKPKPSTQRAAPKPASTNVSAPSRPAAAAVTAPDDAAAAKPKPKPKPKATGQKPAPKPAPAAGSTTQQTSQAR
jgi:D-alanyl-D-alanine carboxypeptidase